MEKIKFLRTRKIYIPIGISMLILGYFAMISISILPKPSTISEFIKYYFHSPIVYLKAIFLTLLAFISTELFGFATILHGIYLENANLFIRIVLGVLGIVIMALAFYFFSYFLLLIISVGIIGVFAMVLLGNNEKN